MNRTVSRLAASATAALPLHAMAVGAAVVDNSARTFVGIVTSPIVLAAIGIVAVVVAGVAAYFGRLSAGLFGQIAIGSTLVFGGTALVLFLAQTIGSTASML